MQMWALLYLRNCCQFSHASFSTNLCTRLCTVNSFNTGSPPSSYWIKKSIENLPTSSSNRINGVWKDTNKSLCKWEYQDKWDEICYYALWNRSAIALRIDKTGFDFCKNKQEEEEKTTTQVERYEIYVKYILCLMRVLLLCIFKYVHQD